VNWKKLQANSIYLIEKRKKKTYYGVRKKKKKISKALHQHIEESQSEFIKRRVHELKQRQTRYESAIFTRLKKILPDFFNINPLFQHPIRTYKSFFILDIYIPKVKFDIELDGNHHKDNLAQRRHDIARDDILKKMGITTLRFTNQEVLEDPKRVVNSITGRMQERLHGASFNETKPSFIDASK